MGFFGGAIKGFYQSVKRVFADNGSPRVQTDAFGNVELASHNRAVGALQTLEVAPDAASRQPVTVRASAILTAAFVVSAEIPTGGLAFFAGIGVYTRGAVGGAPSLYFELARTVLGVDYWYPLSQQEANVLVAGSDGYLQTQGVNITTTSKTAAAEAFPMIVPLNGADKIRISSREIGVPATPGTLAVYGGFQNRCTLPPPATDSKAFEIASNSLRQQEINPLSEQHLTELLVNSAVLNNATYYYPSAAGGIQDGYKDLSFDFALIGNAAGPTTITMTIEGSNDSAWTLPKDITRAGYLVTNPAAGGAASYAAAGAVTTSGILDFDELNTKYWRVKIVVNAANNCTARIWVRRKAL